MRAVIAEMPTWWLEERAKSDASRRDEMWDGVLHMPPAPTDDHQDVELDLASFLKRNWAKPTGGLVRHQVNVTPPADIDNWTQNYRIPDVVAVRRENRGIDHGRFMAGPPDVVVEVYSPGDETAEKMPFYAALGVPEVWVIHRDTRQPELFRLTNGRYTLATADADGWLTSVLGIQFRQVPTNLLRIRMAGDDSTATDIPDQW